MPTIFDNMDSFNLSLRGGEAREIFYKPTFLGEDVFSTFKIKTGVKEKYVAYHFSELNQILQANTGCGWNASGSMNLTPETIYPGKMKVNMEMCADEFYGAVDLEDALTGTGTDIDDLGTTEAGRALLNGVMNAAKVGTRRDLYRLAYFANYNDDGNLTPPAWYTNTLVDTPDNRGVFQKIEDKVGTGQITASSTSLSGSALTAGQSYTIFSTMYANQGNALRGVADTNKVIKASQSILTNYVTYLESLGTEEANRRIINGSSFYTFRGIPIEVHPDWDTVLATFTGASTEHRAILTVQGNITLVTDINSLDNEVKVWYDDKLTEKLYVKIKLRAGFGHAIDDFIVYAK